VIPQSALPPYQPGTSFEVRVDPDDLAAVIIIDSADVIRAAGPAVLATGLAGTAKVRSVFEPLLAAVTGEPMWGLELRVQATDGRPEYAVRLAAGYPPGISRPRRGDLLAVRVDAGDPCQVAIDWGSPGDGHRGAQGARPQRR